MGISLSTFQDRAREAHPGVDIDLEDGSSLRLRSVSELSDDELETFQQMQDRLEHLDSSDKTDIRALKAGFVDVLVFVSDRPEVASDVFTPLSLGVLGEVFKEYVGDRDSAEDAIKS